MPRSSTLTTSQSLDPLGASSRLHSPLIACHQTVLNEQLLACSQKPNKHASPSRCPFDRAGPRGSGPCRFLTPAGGWRCEWVLLPQWQCSSPSGSAPWGSPWFGAHYLRGFQGLDFPGKLHGMLAEVVHGDGVVPVAQTVLGVGRLLLPPQAAHGQQDRCREARLERARGGDRASIAEGGRPASGWGRDSLTSSRLPRSLIRLFISSTNTHKRGAPALRQVLGTGREEKDRAALLS